MWVGLQVPPARAFFFHLVLCPWHLCQGLLPDFLSDPNSLHIQFQSLVSFGSAEIGYTFQQDFSQKPREKQGDQTQEGRRLTFTKISRFETLQ